MTGYVAVTNGVGNEASLTDAIANIGPMSVAIYASNNFQLYSSGVFTDTSCPAGKVNHAVNVVGYGTSNGQDYYILRNSWGTSWGDKGYMLYRRNNKNQCGIASYASYPLVKATGSVTTPATTTNSVQSTPTNKAGTTTMNPVTTTTSRSQSSKCSKGSGLYANPGCSTGYSCQLSITNYKCSSGYLFDVTTNSCRLSSLVSCNPLSATCPNGTGYYTYPGCATLYYCRQTIINYSCRSGYLFDARSGMCRLASTYKCPV